MVLNNLGLTVIDNRGPAVLDNLGLMVLEIRLTNPGVFRLMDFPIQSR